MKCPIEEIITKSSYSTTDGIEVPFENINPLIHKLRSHIVQKTEEGIVHMLEYCIENVGNNEVNTQEELKRWIKKEFFQNT